MKKTKKRNKQDATLINVRAAKKRSDKNENAIEAIWEALGDILVRLDKLEGKRGRK